MPEVSCGAGSLKYLRWLRGPRRWKRRRRQRFGKPLCHGLGSAGVGVEKIHAQVDGRTEIRKPIEHRAVELRLGARERSRGLVRFGAPALEGGAQNRREVPSLCRPQGWIGGENERKRIAKRRSVLGAEFIEIRR